MQIESAHLGSQSTQFFQIPYWKGEPKFFIGFGRKAVSQCCPKNLKQAAARASTGGYAP